jgi:hypothetical protein
MQKTNRKRRGAKTQSRAKIFRVLGKLQAVMQKEFCASNLDVISCCRGRVQRYV